MLTMCAFVSGPTLSLDTRVSHTVLNQRYHFDKQSSLDRDGRQCVSAGITYNYCRLRPVVKDTDQFLQVAMGMKQWDCVSRIFSLYSIDGFTTDGSEKFFVIVMCFTATYNDKLKTRPNQ